MMTIDWMLPKHRYVLSITFLDLCQTVSYGGCPYSDVPAGLGIFCDAVRATQYCTWEDFPAKRIRFSILSQAREPSHW